MKQVHYYKYLGFIIDDTLSNKDNVIRAINQFYGVFNMLLRTYHYDDTDAFLTLFNAYLYKF